MKTCQINRLSGINYVMIILCGVAQIQDFAQRRLIENDFKCKNAK